jgi:hypothetical protein
MRVRQNKTLYRLQVYFAHCHSESVTYRLIRPLLFGLDAESAHGLSLAALRAMSIAGSSAKYPNPVFNPRRIAFSVTCRAGTRL